MCDSTVSVQDALLSQHYTLFQVVGNGKAETAARAVAFIVAISFVRLFNPYLALMHLDDVFAIAKDLGLKIRWFDNPSFPDRRDTDRPLNTLVRSFYEAPNTLYLNRELEKDRPRLKYDVANNIGHLVLHGGDGARAPQVSGGRVSGRRHEDESLNVDAKDILYAWRDFECSYFAAALLAPKTPFRQFLARQSYAINAGDKLDLTTTLVMRRMSSVSPYPHWHYFDAYPPGNLRAVYRGNGIPLPWGNMTMISDPCQHWAVFRMLNTTSDRPSAQISVLRSGDDKRLYCCESIRSTDIWDEGWLDRVFSMRNTAQCRHGSEIIVMLPQGKGMPLPR